MADLVNLDYGAWEGLSKEECVARDPDSWWAYAHDPEGAMCPSGEPLASAADRAVTALRLLGRRHAGEAVAAVSHGVMLRLAVLRVCGAPPGGWQFKVPTGSALEFAVGPSGISPMTPLAGASPDPYKHAAAPTVPA